MSEAVDDSLERTRDERQIALKAYERSMRKWMRTIASSRLISLGKLNGPQLAAASGLITKSRRVTIAPRACVSFFGHPTRGSSEG